MDSCYASVRSTHPGWNSQLLAVSALMLSFCRACAFVNSGSSAKVHCDVWKTDSRMPFPLSLVRLSATCCGPGIQRHSEQEDSSCNVSFKDNKSRAARGSWGRLSLSKQEKATRASMTKMVGQLETCLSPLRTENGGSHFTQNGPHKLSMFETKSCWRSPHGSWTPDNAPARTTGTRNANNCQCRCAKFGQADIQWLVSWQRFPLKKCWCYIGYSGLPS